LEGGYFKTFARNINLPASWKRFTVPQTTSVRVIFHNNAWEDDEGNFAYLGPKGTKRYYRDRNVYFDMGSAVSATNGTITQLQAKARNTNASFHKMYAFAFEKGVFHSGNDVNRIDPYQTYQIDFTALPACQSKSFTNKPWAHQHCGAWGQKPYGWTFLFQEGLHNVPAGNIDMSSVNVPEGWTLTLYNQPDGKGRQKKFVGPTYCPCFLQLAWDGSTNMMNDTVRSYVLDITDTGGFSGGGSSTTPPPLDSTPLVTLPPETTEKPGMSKQTMIMIAVAVLVCFLMVGGFAFMMMMR
jgi:hypothetical protein